MFFTTEKITLNKERNITLVTMLQSVGGEFERIDKRPAILILPGGGYSMCSDREAEVIAYPFLYAGYHAFVLRYSVKENRTWPNPLQDYEQAMALIRSKADEWHILPDKIAVIGFSAGGHLAACAATVAKNKPNAAILGYAAMEQDIADLIQPGTDVPSPTDHVSGQTPPCFLFAARDDAVVPIHNSLNFQLALAKYGIQFESHIYAYGGHGFGTGAANIAGDAICRRIPNWVRDAIGWLEDIFGVMTPNGLGTPVCPGKICGDYDDVLSIDCTYGYMKTQTAADSALEEFYSIVAGIIQARFSGNPKAAEILNGMTIREMMLVVGFSQEKISSINVKLQNIQSV